jgi:hypothetical protein
MPRITDVELPFVIARFYLEGHNHWTCPWVLPPQLLASSALRKVLYEGSFASFATKGNLLLSHIARRNSWYVLAALLSMIPPLALWWRRRFQRHSILALHKYVSSYGAGFFRDLDVRSHGASIRLGFSPDLHLGYLDLLISPDAQQQLALTECSPPLLFLVAGYGVFDSPFYIDSNDALLRAVPTRLEILRDFVWLEFIASLNQLLRRVVILDASSRCHQGARTYDDDTDNGTHWKVIGIEPVLEYITRFNNQHQLNGFEVQLGTFHTHNIVFDHHRPHQNPLLEGFHVWTTPSSCTLPSRNYVKLALYILDPATVAAVEPMQVEPVQPPLPSTSSIIRFEALSATASSHDAPSLHELYSLLPDERTTVKQKTWTPWITAWHFLQQRTQLLHVTAVPTTFQWWRPVLFLILVLADVLVSLWIAIEYFCIQVLDPTAHSTGCTHVGDKKC